MYNEQRYIKTQKNNSEIQLIDEQSKNTLYDILGQNNRIVLLGNPGISKSTELYILFHPCPINPKKQNIYFLSY